MSALSSKLDAVTVFREGALCRRLATVAPSKERQVRLGGLPLSLDPGSFRAKVVSGTGKVVDVRAQFDVEFVDEANVPEEQKALEAAAVLVAKLELERTRLQQEITELQALKPSFLEHKRGEPPRAAPVESMLALGEFTEGSLGKRLERRRKLERELQDARDDQHLRLRRLAEATAAKRTERSRLWRVAVVTFAEAPAEPLGLELEYRVPGARWVPAYALTLDKGLGNGTLQMRASIAQNTGEDWSQVNLALSTASASRRADMPELKSLKIGRRQEAPPRSGWREPPPGLDSLFEAYDQSAIHDRYGGVLGGLNAAPDSTVESRSSTRAGGYSGDLKTITGFAAGAAGVVPPPQKAQRSTGSFAPPPAPPPPPRNAPMAMPSTTVPMPSRPAPAAPGGGGRAVYQAVPEMQAAPKSGGAFSRLRGAMKKDMAYDDDDMREEAPAAEMSLDEGGYFGGDADGIDNLLSASAAGGIGGELGSQFGDYARLTMPPASAGSGSRGRLTQASEWDFAFIAGLSIQIDVVMAVVSRAQHTAHGVSGLALPALCNPVTSVKSFDYRYDCGARLDVPSTGKWTLVPVMKCAVGLTPEYVCVPSVEQKVYRTLTIANRSSHALLPGPVDVTSGDEFLMTTSLPAIPPNAGGSHRLGLGVEEAIKVARKTQYKETTGGFLGGSSVLPHDIEIELNNRLAAPALIEVRERVPVVDPNEKDLKVEEVAVAPAWEKVETPIDDQVLKGARRWRVTVQPGQSMKLTAQYAIRMPSDRMLNGGNRRN